ncbi:MAG: 5'-methylthioadenosine/S-adenosylhomocysteine nucleosidase [Gammaproteobacteria bacterium]|nr:5'-methylthioadenosine/S-adenosylhomocysteine nucleosidase [Gammaproteobacteria bacterium]
MLHIVCALKPEARPLLDRFGLRALPDEPRIYHNAGAHISLTRSGIGKSADAGAAARTHEYFDADRSHAWLNLGIAGHADLPLGQAVIVKKVTDAASGETWFPSRVFPVTIPAHDLVTLDEPGSDYREELFDMECAGFFQAVSGVATLELAQALKIVSDNADEPMDSVKPALVSRLVQQNLPVIEEIAEQLLALSKLLQDLNNPEPDYHAITASRHFTVSQQHQLRAALRKWRALQPEDRSPAERLAGKKTAAEALRYLQDELDKSPIRLV